MVGGGEICFFSSTFKLYECKSSSGIAVISEVDEMPFLDFSSILNKLVNVRVSSTNKVRVCVSSESVDTTFSWSDESWQISISLVLSILESCVIMDRQPEGKVPGLLLLRRHPLEPTCNSVFIWERIGRITLNNVDLVTCWVEFDFCVDDFLNSLLLATWVRLRIASKSVFHNLIGVD